MLDIKHYACSGQSITDDVKHQLLENREPEKSFKFPPKQHAMKLSKTGYVNRYCSQEWFRKFDFIKYLKSEDGLYCLACVLFPDTSHHHPKKLITEPYQIWKDAMEDLLSCDYHITH